MVSEGVVVVRAGDGRIFGLDAADGKTKWVQQRSNPALTLRNTAGGVASRGDVFAGIPGGRLLALDLRRGTLGWDGVVATPKGATELERIADVTGRPGDRGRAGVRRRVPGPRRVLRDRAGRTGVVARHVEPHGHRGATTTRIYVADDNGAMHALDKSTGASLWKQDKLAGAPPGGAAGRWATTSSSATSRATCTCSLAPTGAFVGRLATDGSAPIGQPLVAGGRLVFQSANGTLFAVATR